MLFGPTLPLESRRGFDRYGGAPAVLDRSVAGSLLLAAAYAFLTGLCGTLIGIIQMLSNLGNPAMIGSGLALTLLTQFYGVLLAVLCIGLAAFQSLRYPHETKLPQSTRLVVPTAAAATTVGTAAVVGIGVFLLVVL